MLAAPFEWPSGWFAFDTRSMHCFGLVRKKIIVAQNKPYVLDPLFMRVHSGKKLLILAAFVHRSRPDGGRRWPAGRRSEPVRGAASAEDGHRVAGQKLSAPRK